LIPEASKMSQGVPWHRVSPLSDTDTLSAVFSLPANKSSLGEEICVITATRFGMIKKSLVTELPGPSSQTFVLVKVNEGDRLGWVGLTNGKKEILLVTASGMAIRFKEDDVRPMGLVAAGVNGMKLEDKDEVVGAEILPADGDVFLLTNDGKAKRVDQKDFPVQGRYGKGVVAWDLPNKSTLVAVVTGKPNHVATIHMSKGAPKSARLDAAALRKRASSKGDVVVEVKPGEMITSLAVGWMLESYVKVAKAEEPKPAKKAKEAKAPAKKAAKPAAKAKPASKGKASKPVKKTSASKKKKK
jgi:DNA gyrase subunit A